MKSAAKQVARALIQRTDASGITTITLNRPDAFNALSEALLAALQQTLDAIALDDRVRVVVIAGSDRAFCAGHDLKQMRDDGGADAAYHQQLFADCSRMMMTLTRLPQPVIAKVRGIATAAGCQLVSMCDLAVAEDGARFATSGINYGLFCSTPSVGLSRNVPRKHAMEMLLTGEFIDAAEAARIGLINRAVAAANLDAEVARLCGSIAAKPAASIALGKRLFYRQIEMGMDAAYQLAAQTMACDVVQAAAQEGLAAFTEKRAPKF